MAHLCILQPDTRTEARFRDALAGVHDLTALPTWAGLRRCVSGRDVEGCIVDGDTPSRDQAMEEIAGLRAARPDLAIVAHADVLEADPALLRLGALGIHGVISARKPPWAANIRRTVDRALTDARAERVAAGLPGVQPPAASAAVAWAFRHATEAPPVAALAAGLGHSTHSLSVLLRTSGLPSPGRILIWGRLLHAGALLGGDGRTVEETALRLGYATAGALSRAMKRETGMTPGEVARHGGLACVLSALAGYPPSERR